MKKKKKTAPALLHENHSNSLGTTHFYYSLGLRPLSGSVYTRGPRGGQISSIARAAVSIHANKVESNLPRGLGSDDGACSSSPSGDRGSGSAVINVLNTGSQGGPRLAL